jgi:hypothetical protein
MPPGVPQTRQELEGQLAEQLDHLQASAERFDKGVHSEAKRLAVAICNLVYDRGQSRSILGQLGHKGMTFLDSSTPYDPANPADHWGLVVMTAGGSLPTFVAPLDLDRKAGRWCDFDTWWGGVVFRDNHGREITRGELVRTVRDQDGGAHVDSSLREVYAALSRQNSLGWTTEHPDGRREPADPPHLHAIRQVAHELLKTLVPDYTKQPVRPRGTAFAWGLRIEKSTPEQVAEYKRQKAIKAAAQKVPVGGRNDPCPCGSGKKYKKCHGAPKTS